MTRRIRSTIVAGLGLTLVACAHAGVRAEKPASDVLVLRSAQGFVAFESERGTSVPLGASAVLVTGTRMFVVLDGGMLARVDAATGRRDPVTNVEPAYRLAAVSSSGRSVALAGEFRRGRTSILIADTDTSLTRRYSLLGQVIPEAFSTDGARLFLIHYLEGSTRYRLIELNLADGAVAALGARVKQPAPEEMVGAGRAQVAAPDGRVLYTLYTRQPASFPHGRRPGATAPAAGTAFVHVLNLEAGTAHCVELPELFGAGAIADDAMTISPDGAQLFVVDSRRGRAVTINTATLRPGPARSIGVPPGNGRIFAAADGAGSVYVARGATVTSFDDETFSPIRTWTLPSPSDDIGIGRSGRLFAGSSTGVYRLGSDGRVEQVRPGGARLAAILV